NGMDALREAYPGVRLVCNAGQRTPMELASLALREATGDLIIVTEDHCVPRPDWVRRLVEAQGPGKGAVGGAVETEHSGDPLTWAFYLVDYYRYMRPFPEGPAQSLTVCNVSYRRDQLEAIAPLWREFFHETAINAALAERFGPLWLAPAAEVRTRRDVTFSDAIYERYAFGRLFGVTRNRFAGLLQRLVYAALSPALPPVILWRMGRRAFRRDGARLQFIRALPALAAMSAAWAWGEWLGYVTNRMPGSLVVAPEIREAERREGGAQSERPVHHPEAV
ncbi:MAG: glycosyltransferase, partial [Gemmatimonadales bacterium]